ncbi:MAG: hypothetical protein ACKOFG_05795 [Limnohabitans sp.]
MQSWFDSCFALLVSWQADTLHTGFAQDEPLPQGASDRPPRQTNDWECPLISSAQLEQALLSRLLETWKTFIDELPPSFDPASAITALEAFGQSGFETFRKEGAQLVAGASFPRHMESEEGMNSPGILWDRLTILNCKHLFTSPESVHHKPAVHRHLGNVRDELISVTKALARALPARNILLAKEATERQRDIAPLEASLWNLQMSNIAMWINQDLLYTVSADDVDAQRLRDYIVFFSKANRIRNTAIENIELFYSQKMQRNH